MNNNYVYQKDSKRWFSLKDFNGEVWKDIPNYEGLYMASSKGRVKSLKRVREDGQVFHTRILKFYDNGHGYLIVTLCKDGIMKKYYVHRLVAAAFIPNPLQFKTVNHKDENKYNNQCCNLEWCTQAYNNKYGTARERLEKARRENGNTRQIDMYDINGVLLKRYTCAYDVEKDGLNRRAVYGVCSGRIRSYKGCVFRYSGDAFSYREKDKYPKGKCKEVIKTNKDGDIICVYRSIKEAERDNNLSRNFLNSATYSSARRALIGDYYFEIKKY